MARKISVRDIIMGENIFKGKNFPDWEMNLRIVLGAEKLFYVIERPLEPEPGLEQPVEHEIWKTHHDDNFTAQSVMFAAMTP